MSLEKENEIEIRIITLKEMQKVFRKRTHNSGALNANPITEIQIIQKNIADLLRNAEADKIALTDPERANTVRNWTPVY